MSRSKDILIDVLKQASVRIHWAFLASLIGCAVIGSSLYHDSKSYNNSLTKAAQIFILDTEEKLAQLERNNPGDVEILKPNGRYTRVAPFRNWHHKDAIDYSNMTAGQQRAINALKDLNLRSAQAPIVPLPVPLNDLDILGGTLLVVLSMWIYFSMNQIVNIMENKETFKIISEDIESLRYIFMTVHFRTPFISYVLVFFTIFMPFIIMLVATIIWYNAWDKVHEVGYAAIIKDPYLIALRVRIAITGALLYFAASIGAGWIILVNKFNQHTP
jgi:hypothetical protein